MSENDGFQIIIIHQPGYRMFPVVAPEDADIKVGDYVGIERGVPGFVVDSVDLSLEDYEIVMDHLIGCGSISRIRSHARPAALDYGVFGEEEEKDGE